MTSTERHNIDDALLTRNQVLRATTDDTGTTNYTLYELTPVQKFASTAVAAFGTIFSVTITP